MDCFGLPQEGWSLEEGRIPGERGEPVHRRQSGGDTPAAGPFGLVETTLTADPPTRRDLGDQPTTRLGPVGKKVLNIKSTLGECESFERIVQD